MNVYWVLFLTMTIYSVIIISSILLPRVVPVNVHNLFRARICGTGQLLQITPPTFLCELSNKIDQTLQWIESRSNGFNRARPNTNFNVQIFHDEMPIQHIGANRDQKLKKQMENWFQHSDFSQLKYQPSTHICTKGNRDQKVNKRIDNWKRWEVESSCCKGESVITQCCAWYYPIILCLHYIVLYCTPSLAWLVLPEHRRRTAAIHAITRVKSKGQAEAKLDQICGFGQLCTLRSTRAILTKKDWQWCCRALIVIPYISIRSKYDQLYALHMGPSSRKKTTKKVRFSLFEHIH